MRDPKRIREILGRIEKVWSNNPDLRLGQIIENAVWNQESKLFFIEDNVLIDLIDKKEKQ